MAVTRETLRLLDGLRIQIDASVDAAARDLILAWGQAWSEVAAEWDAAMTDLTSTGGVWPSPRQIRRAERAARALKVTRAALRQVCDDFGARVLQDVPDLVADGARWQARLVASQMPPTAGTVGVAGVIYDADYFNRVDARALDSIVERTTEQVTTLARQLPGPAYQALKGTLIRGVAVGDNPRKAAAEMVRRVRGAFDMPLYRALVIARTEMLDAHRASAYGQDQANSDVLAGWVWTAQLSKRTCPACWSKHGNTFALDEPGPQGHQQCLPAGVVVSGPAAVASTARWYSGEMVEVEASAGHRLTVTPNHPVLTTAGWVKAGDLREGHYLVCGVGREGPPPGGSPDKHQMPALIEDVAQSVGGASPMGSVTVPTSAEDFHGDGVGSEVHVVRADRLLWGNGHAPSFEPPDELSFGFGAVSAGPFGASLAGQRSIDAVLKGLIRPSDGSVGRGYQGSVLSGSPLLSSQSVGSGQVALRHTCGRQPVVDRTPRHAERIGQGFHRLASQVAVDDLFSGQGGLAQDRVSGVLASEGVGLRGRSPQPPVDQSVLEDSFAGPVPGRDVLATFARDVVTDRVVKVFRRDFHGHVYNLQTATGWYVADGIIVHNCRCTRAPVTRSWADLGFPNVEEPASLLPDAQVTFRGLHRGDQAAILGTRRLALLDQGSIGWDDLSTLRTTPGWRDSWAPTPMRDLLKVANR